MRMVVLSEHRESKALSPTLYAERVKARPPRFPRLRFIQSAAAGLLPPDLSKRSQGMTPSELDPLASSNCQPMLYLYSEVPMLAIRLPQSIEKRLEKLARRTGRTKTFYVRQAILEHLDDLEDLYQAERTLHRIRTGEEETIPLEDLLKRHGLED